MDPAYDPEDPCAGCGICCNPVELTLAVAARAFDPASTNPDTAFLLEHLHYRDMGNGYINFTCDAFQDGRCTAYENRPRMCSEYPFYGRAPETAPLNSTCTFHDQVPGRRVLPLTVIS